MSGDLQRHLERAEHLFEIGQVDGAIDALRYALTQDPDLAEAHAWLAICLLRKRRLHAAAVEAGLALTLAPELPLSHWVNAEIALAKRDFKQAERHIAALLAEVPEHPGFHRLKARWLYLVGRGKARLESLEEALRHDPNDPETLADLAEYFAEARDLERAFLHAEAALQIAPENRAALVAMGMTLLLRGDAAGAREHAVLALRADATDPAALRLIASVKMRSNPLLGLWWRYATWMESIGPTRNVLVLLAAFVVYRIAVIASSDAGAAGLAAGIEYAWLAIVVYSFAGPTLFRSAVQRELASVTLRKF